MCNASRASLNDRASHTDKRGYNTHMYQPPPPQALCFSHGRGERETRVTGHEPQGTIGKVQTEGYRPLFPSRLPLRAHRRETSGYEVAHVHYRVTKK